MVGGAILVDDVNALSESRIKILSRQPVRKIACPGCYGVLSEVLDAPSPFDRLARPYCGASQVETLRSAAGLAA
jgi:hypothetical protein